MKKRNTRLLAILSTLILAGLLMAQGFWVWRSASVKEEQFRQQVAMAMCRTAEALCADDQACESLNGCCMMRGKQECRLELDAEQKSHVDSLLRNYMDFYHVPVDYTFEIVRSEAPGRFASYDPRIFRQRLEGPGLPAGYQLHLHLPGKSKFLLAEMSPLFILSALLIVALIGLFVMTLRALARDRRVLRQTTDFVNNMVHEFRTPLTNISLATGLIARAGSSPEKREQMAEIIRNESERLKLQVDRLLEITELEREERRPEKKPVAMHELLGEQVKCIKVQVQERGGEVNFSPAATQATVAGDALMLSAAVRNLLDNAVKYSQGAPFIRVETVNMNDRLVVHISDRGIGIDPKLQQLVFDKFYRVTKGDVHDVKGFGLGLALVKKIILLHGGTVSVKSEPGKGSTFTLSLPVMHEPR